MLAPGASGDAWRASSAEGHANWKFMASDAEVQEHSVLRGWSASTRSAEGSSRFDPHLAKF